MWWGSIPPIGPSELGPMGNWWRRNTRKKEEETKRKRDYSHMPRSRKAGEKFSGVVSGPTGMCWTHIRPVSPRLNRVNHCVEVVTRVSGVWKRNVRGSITRLTERRGSVADAEPETSISPVWWVEFRRKVAAWEWGLAGGGWSYCTCWTRHDGSSWWAATCSTLWALRDKTKTCSQCITDWLTSDIVCKTNSHCPRNRG